MFFKKSNKQQQSGRSMVEMLGVLAIIGVLSIGGIAGYTLSMRRYRANQVLDAVNKYALVVYGDCQKALLDGEITDITKCKHHCYQNDCHQILSFEDANLGTVADTWYIYLNTITQQSGVDIVEITANFNDKAVCSAAKNIAGVKDDWYCSTGNGSNSLDIPFKFN